MVLKQSFAIVSIHHCFISLLDYMVLKLEALHFSNVRRFISLLDYMVLKPQIHVILVQSVR